jgi:hypothetical protein
MFAEEQNFGYEAETCGLVASWAQNIQLFAI